MHRFIMNAPADAVVDHVHGKTLDNRKSELRITNLSVNNHNRVNKPPSNVHWHRQNEKWRVRFMIRRQLRDFGCFTSLPEATEVAAAIRQRLRRGELV